MNTQQIIESEYVSAKQISLILNIPIRTVYRLFESGELPSYSFTERTYRTHKSDLEKWIKLKKN